MRFLCKGLKFGLLKTNYFRFCANVCRAVTMRLLRNRHHFKLMKSKFKGKEKFVAACLHTSSRKTSHQETLCLYSRSIPKRCVMLKINAREE